MLFIFELVTKDFYITKRNEKLIVGRFYEIFIFPVALTYIFNSENENCLKTTIL